jgi:transmembrane sensor
MDKNQRAKELISKYHQGTASPEERLLVEQWFLIDLEKSEVVPNQVSFEKADQKISANLSAHIAGEKPDKGSIRLWPRVAVAASRSKFGTSLIAAAAVAAITLGTWLYYAPRHPDAGQDPGSAQYATDIAPGKNGATITLGNGKVIQLSDSKTGVVIGKDLKYSDSTLVIQSDSEGSRFPDGSGQALGTRNDKGGEDVVQMTASTAKGQTYQFTLPDGTKVWLNADSKLEFPSSFVNSKTRFVKLLGEGYFEVAKDKAHPFIVATEKQEVEVLGTHFNINSYADERAIKTTLLEGSVRVASLSSRAHETSSGQAGAKDLDSSYPRNDKGARNDEQDSEAVILKPNQQSVLTGSNRIKVEQVDTEGAVAWKNGLFMFDAEALESIMMKVARWYNVEVSYENEKVGKQVFSGSVSRFAKVSSVLSKLEKTGPVKFKIEGRKITVMAIK